MYLKNINKYQVHVPNINVYSKFAQSWYGHLHFDS